MSTGQDDFNSYGSFWTNLSGLTDVFVLREVMGRCRYLMSVSVFGIFVGIFSSRFGIQYRYSKILRYRFGISVFQLVHFKGHG